LPDGTAEEAERIAARSLLKKEIVGSGGRAYNKN
jgi:hypothetical protein